MDIEISGKNYKTTKLTPMQQFHVMRKMTPVLFAMGEQASDVLLTKLGGADLLDVLAPCADVIATMPAEDAEYILNTCLSAVSMQQGEQGGWQKIQVQPGIFMFDHVDLSLMLKLTAVVIKENLGNFFSAPPTEE